MQSGTDNLGNKEYMVVLNLKDDAADKFAEVTAANVGKTIAIIYDEQMVSSPTVNETITGGKAYINGMANYEEAEELASMVRIGALNLELETLRSNVVGAELGSGAIQTSLLAGLIGLAAIVIFMIVVYRIQGLAASLGLVGYVGLVLFILNAFDITLTLPGIAGIILSVGMAVDANVIVFERVREEIAIGKTVESAIRAGYQKALSAILDGNITTLIAAAVLGIFGTGTVKGFAYTLAIGIILSMFTALVVTRWFMSVFFAFGAKNEKFYGRTKEKKVFDYIGKRRICMLVSGLVIAAGIVFMAVNAAGKNGALNYSMEFIGGSSTTVTFDKEMTIEEIDENVVPVFEKITGDGAVQTQAVKGTTEVIFKTRTLSEDERSELNAQLEEKFGVDSGKTTAEDISSTISDEMKTDAVVAVLIATAFMLLYIFFRFKDIRFAASSVIALLHDVLVVLAFYAIVRISVGGTFIACMLTLVGYSINATIVIFDRIRENINKNVINDPERLKEIANRSIAQTMTRSIYTSLTTFVMVFFLYIMGVTSVKEFALPLIVGIVCGAYSSVMLASSFWYMFRVKFPVKTEE